MKKIVAIATAYWLVFFSALAYTESARAAEPPVAFKVTRVLDGDTVYGCVTAAQPLGIVVPCFTVRINNLNTPEKRLCHPKEYAVAAACERCKAGATLGLKAKMRAEALFSKESIVGLEVVTRDRYNRVVGNITFPDGVDYAAFMVTEKFGVPYPCKNGKCGARPRPWCPSED